ncbi:hypothetical protein ZIOFF_062256 [Zingiber officinale]|uniref:dUTP diphosphatase n=1 Tax=Zingiber officinale TaxID=94328 RepID=A0A8J5KED3_ZINOF|nr:hypothetical protein ZIOFF_062256 [Zingiber officinale]
MEVDLAHGSQLIYVIPDTMLTIADFYKNIQISILARGYKTWQNGEANLLITRRLVGKLSNTPNVGFAYEVQNVVDYLANSGIRAFPGRRYNIRDVLGQNWIIRQSTINIPRQPTEVTTRNLLDGRISLHFENYQVPSALIQARSDDEDEERAHTIAVLLADEEEDILYVKCLTSTAVLPQRRTEGSAGYDLAVSQNYHIPPYGQAMLNTGISIKTPKEGERIAQLILECCKTSPTIQVHDLGKTKRQDRGFGSTSSQCKDDKANPLCEGPWTPTEKDLLLLIQIEEALLQIQAKPNMKASHHLTGLILSWNNTQSWSTQDERASSTQRNTKKDPIWPTSNERQAATSSTTSERWSLSAKLKKQTLDEGVIMKDRALTGKMPCLKIVKCHIR